MDHSVHNKLISFIWSIADDCLRDVYVRGKYRDVILPMLVLRRLDALLEVTKEKVLEEVTFQRDEMGLVELDDAALQDAAGYVFYNTSKWTLTSLKKSATNNQDILYSNLEEYLDGFSDNVKEIVRCFSLKSQCRHMATKDVLLEVVEKFTSPYINLTPKIVEDPEGIKMPALTNLGMGYVFEELIRKFNEENNEEAGEHFTPREVIELMTRLVFDPLKDSLLESISIYDPACGSGGMLTESQKFVLEKRSNLKGYITLFGKEINDETYAICKSDMMIKGNDPKKIRVGSTLAMDEFSTERFDFMLSNPPYGKSWVSDQKYIKDGKDVIDSRFKVTLADYWGGEAEYDAIPRSSDGQLLFMMEMISKMKSPEVSGLGSRIASVHNGSSLFTGDAGSGESNIRRYIIENDMLDAIVQMPNNLFYNTGITTYIWLLNNNKPKARKGKVQLIDANLMFRKLRKNLGNKNCEFAPEHIDEIVATYLSNNGVERAINEMGDAVGIAAKMFKNEDFGYYKVNIERPDRRSAQFRDELINPLRFEKSLREVMEYIYQEHSDAVYDAKFFDDKKRQESILKWCEDSEITLNKAAQTKLFDNTTWVKQRTIINAAKQLHTNIGDTKFTNFNQFKSRVDAELKTLGVKISPSEKKVIVDSVSWYDETADKVVKKVTKFKQDKLDELLASYDCELADLPDFGYYPTANKNEYTTYESSSDLRDSESIPISQSIYQYFLDEVKPHIDEAWVNLESVKIGYEISFNKHFYRHKPLRSMETVASEIISLEQKAEGLISDILGVSVAKVQG
ncbi:type I restriction-modification system subunit M [Photobacterium leiognathi]|uniref:type I restriction-modification system subunit M n=1 Tax=Photobacterium leiognathi TaxID=553611 RepID=UPI002738254A|nr:class I SAM-dependent DNA methyltransferase [Photobacterium leiognathi]